MQIQEISLESFHQKPIKLTKQMVYSAEYENLNEGDKSFLNELFSLSETQPRKVYNELDNFLRRHPTLCEALSLLTHNYIQRNKIKRADETIIFNYKHNPDQLMVKINYADLCLRKNQADEVEEIFENQWDLVDIFPHRESFHVDEYRAFHTLLGHYFYDKQNQEMAEGHLLAAANIFPKHPSVLHLAKKIYRKAKKNPLYDILGSWKRTSSSV